MISDYGKSIAGINNNENSNNNINENNTEINNYRKNSIEKDLIRDIQKVMKELIIIKEKIRKRTTLRSMIICITDSMMKC